MTIGSLIDAYGYYAVVAGTVLEGETVLALAGYAAHRGHLLLGWVIVLGALGGFIGDEIYFGIGRRLGPRFLGRFPAAARVMPRFERLAERHPALIVILLRFTYGLRTVGPMALGASRMPIPKFAVLNAIGALLWAAVVGSAGYALGQVLEFILADAKRIEELVFGLIIVAGIVAWLVGRQRARAAGTFSSKR